MVPYFIMLLIPAVFSVAIGNNEIRIGKKATIDRKAAIDLFFFIFLFLLIFRDESIGTDLSVYKFRFFESEDISLLGILKRSNFEIGFSLLSKAVLTLSHKFRWMMVICALISVVPVWIMYRKNTEFPFLSIVLFLNIAPFSIYFSGLRQAIAMSFVYPIYICARNKKFLPAVLLTAAAFTFHRSAFVLLLLYPIYNFNLKSKYHLLWIIPTLVLTTLFREPIYLFLVKFMDDVYFEKYSYIRNTGAINFSLMLFAFLLFSFIVPDKGKIDRDFVGLRNICALCATLQVFSAINPIAMRLNYYFLLLIPILIPKIAKRAERYQRIAKFAEAAIILFFAVYYFYHAPMDDILNVYPYAFM